MLTILSKSVFGKSRIRNFRNLKWSSSNNLPNTLTETFWRIRTPNRQLTLIEFLKMKRIIGEINPVEERCLLDAPGVLGDNLFIALVRAQRSGIPLELLMERLQTIQLLEKLPLWDFNMFWTLSGVLLYEIEEIRRSIRKVKKYSGYVRNSSAVGSKRSSGKTRPEPEISEWNFDVETDYFKFLTVGEYDSGAPGGLNFTLMRTKSSKR